MDGSTRTQATAPTILLMPLPNMEPDEGSDREDKLDEFWWWAAAAAAAAAAAEWWCDMELGVENPPMEMGMFMFIFIPMFIFMFMLLGVPAEAAAAWCMYWFTAFIALIEFMDGPNEPNL